MLFVLRCRKILVAVRSLKCGSGWAKGIGDVCFYIFLYILELDNKLFIFLLVVFLICAAISAKEPVLIVSLVHYTPFQLRMKGSLRRKI